MTLKFHPGNSGQELSGKSIKTLCVTILTPIIRGIHKTLQETSHCN